MSVWQGPHESRSIFLSGPAVRTDWQACLCIFYCNPTSLSSLANRGDREAYTEYGSHARIHTWTLSQPSAPIWCACPESIHTKWMVLYMLFLQQPLQDFSFWLRRGTGIIDPSAVPWRAWLPEKMKSSVRGHIWSVSSTARPIGRPHINCAATLCSTGDVLVLCLKLIVLCFVAKTKRTWSSSRVYIV